MSDPDPSTLVCAVGQPDPAPAVVLTVDQLAHVCPSTPRSLLAAHLVGVQRMLDLATAATPKRAAMAVGQVAVESNYLRAVKEDPSKASGPHFENYDPPSALAKRLGNTQTGDGAKFCGMDLLQRTGRANARAQTVWCRANGWSDVDWEATPELTIDPEHLGLASAWYIATHGINDAGDAEDCDDASCRINAGMSSAQWIAAHGGLLDAADCQPGQRGIYGLKARREAYARARAVLGLP